MNNMKKLSMILMICVLILSCKKESINQPPVVSDIELSKFKIGVGQTIVSSVKVTDPERDTINIKYKWYDDFGFSQSLGSHANWRPSKSGVQNLTVEVIDAGNVVKKSITVTVYDCDYRKSLWDDSMFDVALNEYPLKGTISVNELDFSEGNLFFIYGFSKEKLSSVIEFNVETANYIPAFDAKVSEFILKYGKASKRDTTWSANVTNPLYKSNKAFYWEESVRNGNLQFMFIWYTPTTKISLILAKINSVVFATIYDQK